MKFDIGIWWHWLFIATATLGSAWNACRVFLDAYNASHSSLFPPFFQFFFELASSFAGWMALWALLPLTFDCAGGECRFAPGIGSVLLLAVAVLGISGRIPDMLNRLVGSADHR